MVLAAGLGVRMRPLTFLRAKPALPVLNRPLIHWTLERLSRHGITDVVINLHHLPATVVRAVGDGGAFGLRVTYSRERRILGTAGGPRRVRSLLGDAPFLLVNGDVVFDFDLTALVERHRASRAVATLALKPNPDRRTYGAVVTGPDGRVRSLAGRPRPSRGTLSLFTGVHVLDPALLDRLPTGPSDTVRDLYARLVEEGERVLGFRVRGAWYDFGSPSLYLASQMSLLASGCGGAPREGLVHPSARLDPTARIVRSVVGPRARLGEGATVVRSVLWERVRIGRGAEVRDSILLDGARVEPGESVKGLVVAPAAALDRSAPAGEWLLEVGTS